MTEIRVPTLGESVTEATIGRWFKKAGDAVAVDEPLVELETDKVTIEVPAPVGRNARRDHRQGWRDRRGRRAARPDQRGRGRRCEARCRCAAKPATPAAPPPPPAAAPAAAAAEGAAGRCAAGALGAQALRRERRRCHHRAGLGQGWPRHQGRHAGRDREGRLSADPGQSARRRRAGARRRRRPTMPRARSA